MDAREQKRQAYKEKERARIAEFHKKYNIHLVTIFDGGYNRDGYITVRSGTCTVCKQNAKVIAIDSSEGEYTTGHICKSCANKAFAEVDE